MIKIFLSHSSKDKESYVRNVANWLDKNHIIYDEFSFEQGEKNLDEILRLLDETSIFVVFISEDSLSSEWVQLEMSEAKSRLDAGLIKQIFPIVIDGNISYQDSRIPEWLRNDYNLRPIKKAKLAATRIQNKLREVTYSIFPKIKEKDTLFVGRNDKLNDFEERIHNFDKNKPLVIFASGFTGVGRRAFLHYASTKTKILNNKHKPISIILDNNSALEDFIYKLNDLNLIDIDNELNKLSQKTIEEKISLVHQIMHAAIEDKEVICLIDDGAIVNYRREMNKWFTDIINTFPESNRVLFSIAARYKVQFNKRPKNTDKYYFIELNELTPNERKWLLSSLLDVHNKELEPKDFESLANLLYGYPDQILFAVDYVISDLSTPFIEKLPIISAFSDEKAAILLSKHHDNEDMLEFIRLLAQFEVITVEFIFTIASEEKYFPLLEQLVTESIVEYLGVSGDVIRLNDIVREYIKRNKVTLKQEFIERIKIKVKELVNSNKLIEEDSSIFIYSLKEALKEGLSFDQELLIPSHYLRSIKDIYNSKGNLDKIIELSDIILRKEKSLDKNIAHDIRYYLCLALAKQKNKRLLTEVQKIQGDEHSFLLGFYYRMIGRHSDAIDNLKKIINAPYVEARAKRELVQVYVYLEEYDIALDYAKNNFVENKSNPFHIQAYFNCLINSENAIENRELLEKLITNLESIGSTQSIEMSKTASALFTDRILHNPAKAFDIITDAIDSFPYNIYPILTYCDIALKRSNIEKLQHGVNLLDQFKNNKSYLSNRTLHRYKAFLYALQGNKEEALNMINQETINFPPETQYRMKQQIEDLIIRYEAQENNIRCL